MNRFYILLSAFIFTLLSGLSTTLTADDTEIYLRQVPNLADSKGRPNILFILDRSSSMEWKDRDENGNLLYDETDRLTRLKDALLQMLTEIQNVNVGFMGFSGYAGSAAGAVSGGNAAVLFPITFIDEEAKNVPGELDDSASLRMPILDYADDAEEGNTTGKVYLDDKTIEMVYSGDTQASLTGSATANYDNIFMEYKEGENAGTIDRTTSRFYLGNHIGDSEVPAVINGLRFVGVTIPQGASIKNASIAFVPNSNVNGTIASRNKELQLKIRAVLMNNATDLALNDDYTISNQWENQTADEVTWDPGNWSEFTEYNTSDISSLVQQVVDLDGWQPGNALGIVIETDGDSKAGRLFDHVRETPVLNVSYTLEGGGTIINNSVSYANDNGFENIKKENYTLGNVINDEGLHLGYTLTTGGTYTLAGFRFRNILIPPKAIIKSATIEMYRIDGSRDNETNDLVVRIYAEDADDTDEFSPGKGSFDLSNRSKTSNTLDWVVPNVGKFKTLKTPDISKVIQEVVDREGWLSGNSMAVFMQYLGDDTGLRRQISTFSGDGANSRGATLTILYEEEKDEEEAEEREPELQTVGLRFQNVGVPQGARIIDAEIEFTSGFGATDEAVIDIYGEYEGNSEPFSNSAPISERNRTTTKVRWEAEPWEWTDSQYSSPSLKGVVQNIVNKSDWCGNNALSFIFTAPTGLPLRNVVAYDTDPEKAPVLKVKYDITSVKDNSCMRYLFTKQVSDANDDMEETRDGIVYADSRTLDMTTKSGEGRIVGLRFQDIPMAKGTEVLSAKLIFTALKDVANGSSDETSLSRSASLKVYGEATSNSEPFDVTNKNLSGRSKTSSISWGIDAADKWESGRRYSSIDIGPIIQDIVDQGGWKPGNALSLFVDGSGLRQAASFERALTDAPMLQVEVRGSLAQSASTVRERMKLMVENIEVDSTTPLVDTIYETAMYLEGGPVTFGKDRKYQRTKRVSHRGSWKDGELFRPEGCTSSDPWAVECQGEKITGSPNYVPPKFDECQKTYIVFLTDGGATANSSYNLVPKLVGGACKKTGSIGPYEYVRLKKDGSKEPQSNIDELCGVDVVEYMHEKDYDSTLEGKQNVIVHTVGFNLGPYYDANGNKKPFESQLNERAVPYLKDWAKAGGGNFYEASSSSELTEIFRSIVSSAMTESTSFAAPTLSVNTFNRMYHRDEVYFSLFRPGNTQRWDGNIKKYRVCTGGTSGCEIGDILDANNRSAVAGKYISEAAKSFWSQETDGAEVLEGGAGERLLKKSRNIYTYIGDTVPGSDHQIDLTETPVNTEFVTKELLGDEFMSDDQHERIISWIQGKDVMNEYDDESPFNDKRWLLADPLHSSPVTVTYGGKESKPIAKLFVGTNDGLIRMFDTETGYEEWAFLPQEMLTIQEPLMKNAKGARIYGIDGTASFRIYDGNNNGTVDGDDYVQMFIGMRRGGRNIYALDVTQHKSPKLMWVIKGGIEGDDYEYLGQTWSRPTLAKIYFRDKPKTVLIFAGGYHGDDESNKGGMGNGIYIVEPDTGKLLWRAGSDELASLTLPKMVYPIPSDVALIDSNADAITDRLYVGDIGGQLWRIDLPIDFDGLSKVGVGGRLAMISDLEDKNPQVMHRRRFFYPPEVVRLSDLTYSDTTDYFIVTITTGTRPSPLNVETHDRFYAFRDRAVNGLEDSGDGTAKQNDTFTTLEERDLYDVTPNLIQEGDEGTIQAEVKKLKESFGWYMCFTEAGTCDDGALIGTNPEEGAWVGEKGLASPIILDSKVFFTTYLPAATIEQNPDDVCGMIVPEGESRLYALDLLTGGAAYDFNKGNNDGSQNKKAGDRHMSLRDGITSDISTMLMENGEFRLLTNDLSTLKNAPSIRSDMQPTFWMQE